jgi:hypothetical protein
MKGRGARPGPAKSLAFSAAARGLRWVAARDTVTRAPDRAPVEPLRLPPVKRRRRLPWVARVAVAALVVVALFVASKGADRPRDPYTRPPATTAVPRP